MIVRLQDGSVVNLDAVVFVKQGASKIELTLVNGSIVTVADPNGAAFNKILSLAS